MRKPSLARRDTAKELILQLLQGGHARFEKSTGEFCFDGLRYSSWNQDWFQLVEVIGRVKIIKTLYGPHAFSTKIES